MCKVYHFIKTCPNHTSGPVEWVADWDLTSKSPRCLCRLVRRRQWGSCPGFDKHFAKNFKNDRDVRLLHCDQCLKHIMGHLKNFLERGGWGHTVRDLSDCSSGATGTPSEDSSEDNIPSVNLNRARTV